MNKKGNAILIIFLLVILILALGFIGFQMFNTSNRITGMAVSEPEEKKIICNSPYIRVADSCCLDKNYNKICDKDEVVEEVVEEIVEEIIVFPPAEPKYVVESIERYDTFTVYNEDGSDQAILLLNYDAWDMGTTLNFQGNGRAIKLYQHEQPIQEFKSYLESRGIEILVVYSEDNLDVATWVRRNTGVSVIIYMGNMGRGPVP